MEKRYIKIFNNYDIKNKANFMLTKSVGYAVKNHEINQMFPDITNNHNQLYIFVRTLSRKRYLAKIKVVLF